MWEVRERFLGGGEEKEHTCFAYRKKQNTATTFAFPSSYFLSGTFYWGRLYFRSRMGERKKKTAPPTHPMFCEVYFFCFPILVYGKSGGGRRVFIFRNEWFTFLTLFFELSSARPSLARRQRGREGKKERGWHTSTYRKKSRERIRKSAARRKNTLFLPENWKGKCCVASHKNINVAYIFSSIVQALFCCFFNPENNLI